MEYKFDFVLIQWSRKMDIEAFETLRKLIYFFKAADMKKRSFYREFCDFPISLKHAIIGMTLLDEHFKRNFLIIFISFLKLSFQLLRNEILKRIKCLLLLFIINFKMHFLIFSPTFLPRWFIYSLQY